MRFLALVLSILTLLPIHAFATDRVVNIYSAQKEHLIRPILDKFTEKSGIQVKLITIDKKALESRLSMEGDQTKADVVIATDIANLYRMAEKGLFSSVDSHVLDEIVPIHLRSSKGLWFGLTKRARVLFCRKGEAACDKVKSYEDLSRFDGKVLIRSSNNVYNQSLLASLIVHDGESSAKKWAAGVVSRFARNPKGGDRDQLRALASGLGDIAVSNTYYYGLLANSPDKSDQEYAKKIQLIVPNQAGRGAHINIRGIAMAKHAKHKAEAVKLMEFLVQPEAQKFFAEHNYEFPVNTKVAPAVFMKQWVGAHYDSIGLDKVGQNNTKAVQMFDSITWP